MNNYTKEELQFLLDHPEDIETGCEAGFEEGCLEAEIKLIREAIK